MSEQYFHFTLGPVQGFVAQARRTRDFWAGSFLLSWLSAVAMTAVAKQKGEVIFPKVDADYLKWIATRNGEKPEPQQGCIPNRFKGGLAKVSGDFKPELVVDAINQAWQALAEKVWENDLSHCNADTREIWTRQVEHFWEISWALTDSNTHSNLLDRRKNWRTYLPPEEAGVKCMMMDGWQELSGTKTPNAKGLKQFCDGLRNQGGTLKTDLREHEYLCAIAFIKRRFAHCFKDFKAEMPNGWTVHGWKVNSSVPSVAYMAAAPWLAKILEVAPEKELLAFHNAAIDLTEGYGEYKTNLRCIRDVIKTKKEKLFFWNLTSLDGDVFFETSLDNKNRHENQTEAQKVKKALLALHRATNKQLEANKQAKLEVVSPFYAVLMMDGDSLGSQMSDLAKQTPISNSLNHFTQGVVEVVEKHSGFLIYAGGDDVLALLPLEFALNCAYALRQHYEKSFEIHGEGLVTSTLSGAIEYAHIKMPLGKILGDAHHLLDDIAKDGCGRDAIAVRVWKPGGQHLQWAMPWEKAVENDEVVVDRLARDFQNTEQQTQFSNKFFFHINERFALLQSKNEQGNIETVFEQDDMVRLIAAEYLNSGVNVNRKPKLTLTDATDQISPLITQCFPIKRTLSKEGVESFSKPSYLSTDAVQFIRFLAQKGVERG